MGWAAESKKQVAGAGGAMGVEHQQQGKHGEQYCPHIYLAELGDYQLQQFHIGIEVFFTGVVIVGVVAIHMHMHRYRRLLPVKAKMPVQAYTVAEQPQDKRHKGKLEGRSAHRSRR